MKPGSAQPRRVTPPRLGRFAPRGGAARSCARTTELTILLAPGLILFVGFVFVPIVIAAYYSFYNWSGYGPLNDPIGFRNYSYAFHDPAFIAGDRAHDRA